MNILHRLSKISDGRFAAFGLNYQPAFDIQLLEFRDGWLKLSYNDLSVFRKIILMSERIGHVFMSYSRRDEEVMRRITTFLRGQDVMVWVDNEKLVPGTPIWEAEIEKAILGAGAVVVLLSPDSKESEWVRREISYAERYRKHIFPVLVRGDENSSISLRLTNYQYVDIRDNEEMNLNKLSAAILSFLEKSEVRNRGVEETESPVFLAIKGENVKPKVSPQRLESEKAEQEPLKQKWEHTENQAAEPSIVQENNIVEKEAHKMESVKFSHLPRWLVVLWITAAWAIAVSLGVFILPGLYGFMIGTIGGFITSMSLRLEHVLSRWKNILGVTLSWAIGWTIGYLVSGVFRGVLGGAIGGFGMAFFLHREKVLPSWKNILIVTLGWSIGWALVEGLIQLIPFNLGFEVIGALIGAIGGFVTILQIRTANS